MVRQDRSHNACTIFSLEDLNMGTVNKINDQELKATIDAFNDTGYSNDDLFKIIKTAQLPDSGWTTFTLEEMIL